MANNKYTYFSATTSSGATLLIAANPSRRRLNIYSFSLPEETDTNSVWVNTTGNSAVAYQCMQVLPGQAWQFGGTDDLVEPMMLRFQSCPTGAIYVCTSSGTHRGVIEEYA
jgi:hypothetical protein